jgi:hypothetical protein
MKTVRWAKHVPFAAVFLLTLLPFLQASRFDFINLDDYLYIFYNKRLAEGLTAANIGWAFTSCEYGAIWMPLTWLSYMAESRLFGTAPGVFHTGNLLLHAANAGLLFVLVRMLLQRLARASGGRPGRAAIQAAAAAAALFWSLHPLRVEPAVWIASRKDVLSLFWELAALVFWLKGCPSGRPPDGPGADGEEDAPGAARGADGFAALSVFCFALACMAKPAAMTFPVLAGLLEYLATRRVRFGRLLVPCVIAAAVGGVAGYSQHAGGATSVLAAVPFVGRVANAIAAVGWYCFKTAVPTGLALPYLHQWPALPRFFVSGLAICAAYGLLLAGCATAAWRRDPPWPEWDRHVPKGCAAGLRRVFSRMPFRGVDGGENGSGDAAVPVSAERGRVVFTGLAWFLAAVAPMLGLANFGYHSHADRFTYLPAAGFSIPLGYFLAGGLRRGGGAARACRRGAAAALAALACLSWRQARLWRSDETLFAHTLEVTGENFLAHRNLGIYAYSRRQDHETAIRHLSASLKLSKERNFGQRSLYVLILAEAGRLDEAKAEARVLSEWVDAELGKKELSTFIAYSAIAYHEGDKELARRHAEYVYARANDHPDANYLLGLMACDEERLEEAAAHWKRANASDFQYQFTAPRIRDIERRLQGRGDAE